MAKARSRIKPRAPSQKEKRRVQTRQHITEDEDNAENAADDGVHDDDPIDCVDVYVYVSRLFCRDRIGKGALEIGLP